MNNINDIDNLIRKAVRQVISEIPDFAQVQLHPIKKIHVVFQKKWDNRYYLLLEEFARQTDKMVFSALILEEEFEIDEFEKETKNLFDNVVPYREFCIAGKDEIVLFPVISRNEVIEIASCRACSPVTEVIKKCFENGNRICLLKSGMEKLTGKEPRKYQEKILGYYRELLEMDIQVVNNIKELL